MKKQSVHLGVLTLASLFVGTLVGASATLFGGIVAYSGMRPDAALENPSRDASFYRNPRSIHMGEFWDDSADIYYPRWEQDAAEPSHEAAPIDGESYICTGMTHQRRTRCLQNELQNIIDEFEKTY